jgi:hypothetical protein
MVRGKGKAGPKELLTPSELQGLNEEKHDLESTIKEIEDGAGDGRVSIDGLKNQIKKIDYAIHARTPDKPTAYAKDGLYAEEKRLEKEIAVGMPTRYEMRKPTENPGAVRKHLEWDARNKENIQRYVEIQRTLRPSEPKSIEVLRKAK